MPVGELWNGTTNSDDKTINSENFDTLLKYLSSDGTLNGVSTTATATNIRDYTYNGKSTDKAVVVTLGGLKWQVVYLTTDAIGNKVATLWLTGNEQDAFSGRSSTEGEFYGYLGGGLYSDWSANWIDSGTNTGSPYPSNLYSTSYIRVVTLNNGGQYVIGTTGNNSSTLSSTVSKSTSSAFAPFTVTSNGLTDYIVQPKYIGYQTETTSTSNPLQNGTNNGTGNFLNNESINRGGSYSGYNYYNTTITYAKYGEWGSDYLWLPSLSEVDTSGTNGIWAVNETERKNYDGSTTSRLGNVGSTSGLAYAYLWSRSAGSNGSDYAYGVNPSGASRNNYRVSYSFAVRPALHLNLTKINDAVNNNYTLTLNPETLSNGFYENQSTGLFEEYSSQYAIINIYDKDMELIQGVKIQFTNMEDIIKTYIKKDENIYLQVIAPTFATISIDAFNTSFIPIKMNDNKSLLITFSVSQETWFNQSIVI